MENSCLLPALQKMGLSELQATYVTYLKTQSLSRLTVTTAVSDALYLFRHEGYDTFWRVLLSQNFEADARSTLLETLAKHASVDPNTQISAYMSHLRRFRNYAFSATSEERFSYTQQGSKRNRGHLIDKRRRSSQSVEPQLPMPSIAQVEHYLAKWDGLEDYSFQEEALGKLFFRLCPENTCIEDILLKVSTLNDFYSTHIYSTYPVAKHILALDIDERLWAGDLALVKEIQKVTVKGTERNLYSFASKYCSHHNPLAFPIYDSYVDEMVYRFMKQDHFAHFQRSDLKDYQRFYEILLAFRFFYGLEKYNLKEIDKYLWQLGKDILRKYEKKNAD